LDLEVQARKFILLYGFIGSEPSQEHVVGRI